MTGVPRLAIFVSLICIPGVLLAQTPLENRQFVGSAACKACHQAIYQRWSKTRMANVIGIPKFTRTPFFPISPNLTRW
jgi:hypothetical protein